MTQKRESGIAQKGFSGSGSLSTFQELCQVWLRQPYSEISGRNFNFREQSAELQLLFNCSPCVFWILDLRTLNYTYVSPKVAKITGYEVSRFARRGVKFLDSIMHLEDQQLNWQRTKQTWDNLANLPVEERKQFTFNNTYRILKPDGTSIKLLEQNAVWQLDAGGNITHILSIASDITYLEKQETAEISLPLTSKLLSFFSEPTVTLPKSILSKRELQILKLMAAGFNSKHIAEKLFISFHTVNTHRQKMIEKTKTRNTTGVIQYAINKGLI